LAPLLRIYGTLGHRPETIAVDVIDKIIFRKQF